MSGAKSECVNSFLHPLTAFAQRGRAPGRYAPDNADEFSGWLALGERQFPITRLPAQRLVRFHVCKNKRGPHGRRHRGIRTANTLPYDLIQNQVVGGVLPGEIQFQGDAAPGADSLLRASRSTFAGR